MLGTTAALREAKQGSDEGPPRLRARQLQCPCWAAAARLRTTWLRLSLPHPADSLDTPAAPEASAAPPTESRDDSAPCSHPGAAARNNSSSWLPEPVQRFHSAPSSTLVEDAPSSHFQERSSAATHFRSAGTAPSSTTTTGTTDSRRPNHRATIVRRRAPLGIDRLSHESPATGATRSSSTTQKLPHFVDHFRASIASNHAGLHRRAPDTLPHATPRRHSLAARPTATACRRRQASRPLAPRTATTPRASKPATRITCDDADRLFRSNRRAFTRIHSSRNDAFQQHDPKAATRQSRPTRW